MIIKSKRLFILMLFTAALSLLTVVTNQLLLIRSVSFSLIPFVMNLVCIFFIIFFSLWCYVWESITVAKKEEDNESAGVSSKNLSPLPVNSEESDLIKEGVEEDFPDMPDAEDL